MHLAAWHFSCTLVLDSFISCTYIRLAMACALKLVHFSHVYDLFYQAASRTSSSEDTRNNHKGKKRWSNPYYGLRHHNQLPLQILGTVMGRFFRGFRNVSADLFFSPAFRVTCIFVSQSCFPAKFSFVLRKDVICVFSSHVYTLMFVCRSHASCWMIIWDIDRHGLLYLRSFVTTSTQWKLSSEEGPFVVVFRNKLSDTESSNIAWMLKLGSLDVRAELREERLKFTVVVSPVCVQIELYEWN